MSWTSTHDEVWDFTYTEMEMILQPLTWAASMRWSGAARAWCGFFVSLRDGRVLLRHEMTWLHHPAELAAKEIRFALDGWNIALPGRPMEMRHKGVLRYFVAQPTCWPKSGDTGESVSETFAKTGLPMRKGSEDRENGWVRTRAWLEQVEWPGLGLTPRLLVHPDCKTLIRTLPTLTGQDNNPDDVDESPDEYPASGVRMFCMSRPIPTPAEVKATAQPGTWGYELRDLLRPRGRVLGADAVRSRA